MTFFRTTYTTDTTDTTIWKPGLRINILVFHIRLGITVPLGPDCMVNFSPGWNFAPPTEILLRLDAQVQPGRKTQISVSLLRCENTVDAHARLPFSARDEGKMIARLAGLKILARFENTGQGFLARAELFPGLNPSPCNRQFDFKRICFRSRAEIRHVIRPLEPSLSFTQLIS